METIPHTSLPSTQFALKFDESNPNWQSIPDYNKAFLRATGQYLESMLQKQGHLFLNEALDQLGIERFSLAQLVGWLRGSENPVLQFHVREDKGYFILVFDTDGVIYHKI